MTDSITANSSANDGDRAPKPARPAPGRAPDRRQQRRWVPLAAGTLTLLIGLADVIIGTEGPSLVYRHVERPLLRISALAPGTLSGLTRVADVIVGLLLLMLSHGLRRRKRRAWQAVVTALAISVVVHLVHERIGAIAVTLALLVALLIYRREFYATGDPRTRWRALWALCGLILADIVIGVAYLSLTRGLAARYSIGQQAQSVTYHLVGFRGPVLFTSDTRADVFNVLMGGLSLFTLAVVGYLFLRPAEPAARLRGKDAEGIRKLLDRYGDQDSLGYFALRDDKSVIWSPTGKSCIGYRVLSGVMLASGDPIGDPEAWPGAIHAFLDEAARHAWVPSVIGCGELAAEIWCREGDLSALELGDEATVSVADFSLQGRQMRNVRQMVGRVCKQGYVAEVRRVGDIPPAEIRRLVRQADSWRGSPTERGFSMALGRVGGPGDDRCVVATATENGVLRAVLHFVPWGTDGLSLDLMRRDRSSSPGLNDFLIVETIKKGTELGVKHISLNFAVFRAALERGERIGAGPVLRAWRGVLLFMSRWFQIESLYKFNAKFCPQWLPRFLVFPNTRDMPRIGLAAMEAEAFLVWPTVGARRIARKLSPEWLLRRAGGVLRRPRPAP